MSGPEGGADRLLADAARRLERYDTGLAQVALRDALAARPDLASSSEFLQLRAWALRQLIANATSGSQEWLDCTAEGIDAADELLRADPDDADAHATAAAIHAAAGYLRDAELHAREALRIQPDLAEAFVAYADVLTRAGEPRAAMAVARRGLAIHPLHLGLLSELRDARFVADDEGWKHDNAELLRRDPHDVAALHMASLAAASSGDLEGATRHSGSAAREMPGNVAATSNARRLAALDHWSLRPIRPLLLRGGAWWIWIVMFFAASAIGAAIAGPEAGGHVGLAIFVLLALYVYAWPKILAGRRRW